MSRPSKSRSKSGHRKYRQKIDMSAALVFGDTDLGEIVYCYRFPSFPERVKVGYSSRGLARVVEQSTAFPETPELVFVIHHKRAREIEGAFHEALAHCQSDVMGTEWFDAGWDELLAISPILRKAAGVGRLRRNIKFVVTAILLGLGAAAYPMMVLTPLGMTNGLTFTQIVDGWMIYASALADGDLSVMFETWGRVLSLPGDIGPSPVFRAGLAAAAAVPAVLPWIRWRRQAF